MLELIAHTTTDEGLTVTAISDSNIYPMGKKVSDEELAALHLLRDVFHGEWNCTILPQSAPPADALMEAGAPRYFSGSFRNEDPLTSG